MGDRFYMQQLKATGTCPGDGKAVKKKRRLKKDIVADIELILGNIPSLDKMTVVGLEKLLEVISTR